MIVSRALMFVEVEGEAYAVALPQERMAMLVSLAASLSDNGKLPLVKAKQFAFTDSAQQEQGK